MTKLLTDRINRIEVSATMAITAEALRLKATGIELADFGAGEPHFETPRHIKDAAIDAINTGFTRYTAVAGVPEVRKAIVARHKADFGTDYAVEECVFTTGGKLALFNAMQVLVRPWRRGDSAGAVLGELQGHHPVCGRRGEAGGDRGARELPRDRRDDRSGDDGEDEGDHFEYAVEPVGRGDGAEDLEAIVRLAHERGVYVLLDECYVYLTFQGEPVSGASFTECKEHVVVLGSLSKTYAMTGWRAGFALGPKPIIAAMSKLQSQSTSNAASMVQKASIAAVTGSQECVARCGRTTSSCGTGCCEGLQTIPGLTCTVPQGAFYVYPNVSAFLARVA